MIEFHRAGAPSLPAHDAARQLFERAGFTRGTRDPQPLGARDAVGLEGLNASLSCETARGGAPLDTVVPNVHPRKAPALIIERDLTPYVVYSGDPVLRALEKITANKARVIFLVDSHGHLDGVLSDGDFRRWVSGAASLTVDVPAIEAANTSPAQPARSAAAPPRSRTPSGRASTTSRSSTSAATSSRSRSTAPTSSASATRRRRRRTDAADLRDRHQPPGRRLARQAARRPVGRGRRRHREVPAARHGVALPPGLVGLGRRGPRPAVHPRPAREVQPRGRPALRGLRPLPRRRHRRHVHGVGPGQRRPARRLRRPVAQGRVGRHDQPRAAAPHGRQRHPDGDLDRHVHRGRDPRDRRRGPQHRRRARLPALPVDLPGALQGRQPRLPHPPRRAHPGAGRLLRPRARLPRRRSPRSPSARASSRSTSPSTATSRATTTRSACCPASSRRWCSGSARSRRPSAPRRRARSPPAR